MQFYSIEIIANTNTISEKHMQKEVLYKIMVKYIGVFREVFWVQSAALRN